MSSYELLVFLHIAAATIWLGAGFLIAVLVFGAERSGDRQREAGYHRDVGWLAPRLFIPSSLSVLVLGLLLVLDGEWSLDALWIVLALLGWTASFLLGILYFKPEGERIAGLVERQGPGDPEAGRRLHRLNIVDRVQIVILFLVLADMVLKPTGDDAGALITGAVVLATAVGLASVLIRRRAGGAPRAESRQTASH